MGCIWTSSLPEAKGRGESDEQLILHKYPTILYKFPVVRLSSLHDRTVATLRGLPQFIVGRVLPVADALIAPISRRPCVFYSIIASEYVSNEERGAKNSEKKLPKIQLSVSGKGCWVQCFEEIQSLDSFFLEDGLSTRLLLIEATKKLVRHIASPTKAAQGVQELTFDPGCHLDDHEAISDSIKDLLDRKGLKVDYGGATGVVKKRVKLVEVCYEFGQSLAVFVTIRKGQTKEKHSCWVANTVSSDSLDDLFVTTSNWSRGEKAAWKDICHPPAVLVTNDESYWKEFQQVEKIGSMSASSVASTTSTPNTAQRKDSQPTTPSAAATFTADVTTPANGSSYI